MTDAEFREALRDRILRMWGEDYDAGMVVRMGNIADALLPLINARIAEARLEEHGIPPCRDCDNHASIGGDFPPCMRGKQLESELAAAQKKLERK